MRNGSIILRVCACAALLVTPLHGVAFAQQKQEQSQQNVPNALQGFSQNKDQPVKIEAASLEVRDKDKLATFSGNVVVTQGDTTMRCKSLLVYYDNNDNKSGGMKAAQPGPGGSSSIRKLEALGGVHVTQKEQTATGEKGLFDMKSNTITLSGNVLITQGQNVLKGERLVVDVATGAARVEGGRVTGVFIPSSADKDSKDKDKEKDKDAGKAKDGGKGKNSGKSSDAGKSSAPATVPARAAAAAPVSRAAAASSPLAQDTSSAFAPVSHGNVATPDRSIPVAPRGIY